MARQDDHRVRSLRLCRRSQRRDRAWPTLSKPQIYDADGASERHRAGLGPGEERKPASRRVFFVLVSAVNTTWRVTPALYLFLDWVKRIHSREAYTEAQRAEIVSETHSFYGFIHFVMRIVDFRDAIRVLIATIPRDITAGVLNWIYFYASYMYIYDVALCCTVRFAKIFLM